MIRRDVSDHCSFLEEIEAPMWVDLTLEVSNNDQERAEEWFNESHLFHQYSSRQLKSTFSHFSEENGSSDFCLQGPSSPKLPSTVSKSRGKDYRGKKWEKHKSDPSVHQSHPVKVLSATSSSSNECSYLQSKPKSRLVDLRGPSGLKKNLVTERNSDKNGSRLSSKPTLPGSTSNNTSQTKQKSGISFESHQQEEKMVVHVSGQVFGNSTGLSSIIRTSLRKSCVTRQASRVEITGDTGHRSGHKSSGKSSVGSSSHPLYDAKLSTSSQVEDREITPNSRHMARTYQALPNKKERVISGVSSTISNRYKRGKSHLAKPGCPEVAKPEHRNCCSKASLPLRVNAPNSFAKEKPKGMLEVSRLNKSVSKEKENLRRRSPESRTKGNTGKFQRGITGNMSQKGDRRVLVGLKLGDVRGNEGKAIKNVSQKGLLSMR
ncbi:uncharacterized protein LOC115754793 isoform X2 [Rhodamnia argentea]|uniref:Uncharacterized protein LOC115754793 isoform X2 n=1 Tax=Rhodamnia argentea TaxID=178133 RepID=A0ABM3H0C3_9MYRT|nr:uncharacterized protein LOC115754793 isoform X2 [Rhodamnia argentea]